MDHRLFVAGEASKPLQQRSVRPRPRRRREVRLRNAAWLNAAVILLKATAVVKQHRAQDMAFRHHDCVPAAGRCRSCGAAALLSPLANNDKWTILNE